MAAENDPSRYKAMTWRRHSCLPAPRLISARLGKSAEPAG
jgi:hypothetical protein